MVNYDNIKDKIKLLDKIFVLSFIRMVSFKVGLR